MAASPPVMTQPIAERRVVRVLFPLYGFIVEGLMYEDHIDYHRSQGRQFAVQVHDAEHDAELICGMAPWHVYGIYDKPQPVKTAEVAVRFLLAAQ